jgi:hypothetical protein
MDADRWLFLSGRTGEARAQFGAQRAVPRTSQESGPCKAWRFTVVIPPCSGKFAIRGCQVDRIDGSECVGDPAVGPDLGDLPRACSQPGDPPLKGRGRRAGEGVRASSMFGIRHRAEARLEIRSSRSTCPAQPVFGHRSSPAAASASSRAREPLAAHQLAVADGPVLPGVPGRLDSAQLPAPASGGRDQDLIAGVPAARSRPHVARRTPRTARR